jgi:hypothetical protein
MAAHTFQGLAKRASRADFIWLRDAADQKWRLTPITQYTKERTEADKKLRYEIASTYI